MKKNNPAKEQYQRLRLLTCEELWAEEVPAFDKAGAAERAQLVGVVRAVGVVFSETGTGEQKEQARQWLRGLLDDPEEKVRRYAMTALPKIGVDAREEAELLALLKKAESEIEKRHLGKALEKIGGAATLKTAGERLSTQTVRKLEANVARLEKPSTILMDRQVDDFDRLRLLLHCRAGLEEILEQEVDEHIRAGAPFRRVHREKTLVILAPRGRFSLEDVFLLRCFSGAGIVAGEVRRGADEAEGIAEVIASSQMRGVLEACTSGPLRYRLEYVSKGHQRNAVRKVADRVYGLCAELLNDSREAPWQFNISHGPKGCAVELVPRLRPDPRFAYRRGDVPAASHPPLAACLARLAGEMDGEAVWDPFCGSGLELVERTLRGGVAEIHGTDLSPDALETTRMNLQAACADAVRPALVCGDFRDYAKELAAGSLSLIISNPPMGQRVPVPDLTGLVENLFSAAGRVLRPGGRLVFANPLAVRPSGSVLKLEFRRKVDLGGFSCHVEKYVRAGK